MHISVLWNSGVVGGMIMTYNPCPSPLRGDGDRRYEPPIQGFMGGMTPTLLIFKLNKWWGFSFYIEYNYYQGDSGSNPPQIV